MKKRRTDMQKSSLLFAVAGTILLCGCVKDTIYNTDHPEQALVTITTDWSDRGSDIDKPATWVISTTGVKEEASTDRYTLTTFFDPGAYSFYLYNAIAGIPVTDGVAKVNPVPAPEGIEGGFIEPLPGWLFTGIVSTTLEKDHDYTLTTTMHQQVRQLNLLLEVEGSMAGRITAIEGYLTGVAGELNLEDNVHKSASNVTLEFTKITAGADAGKWSTTVRLLGVAGGTQQLKGTVFFAPDTHTDVVLESDLTSALIGFNNDKKTPFTLQGQITIQPDPAVEAGFMATINGWKSVTGEDGIAW